MKFCENFQSVLTAETEDNILITRTRCKLWTCSYCARINQFLWQARIITGIENIADDWSWFTLTAHSQKRSAASSLQNLRGVWDTLVKRMKRKFGKFEYVRVFEPHADGVYHLHCIASFQFDDIKYRKQGDGKTVPYSTWLAQQAKSLKIGYYTHADNISVDNDHNAAYVASYVVKYMTKFSHAAKSEIGRTRHIQTSRGFPKLENERELLWTWTLRSGIYDYDLVRANVRKKKLLDIQTGEIIDSDYFLDHNIYPHEFQSSYEDWQRERTLTK